MRYQIQTILCPWLQPRKCSPYRNQRRGDPLENPVVASSTPKGTTAIPFAGDVYVPQPRNVPEERPETPHSEVTSEGSTRRSENDTE